MGAFASRCIVGMNSEGTIDIFRKFVYLEDTISETGLFGE